MTVIEVLKARIAELERELDVAKEKAHQAVLEAQEIGDAVNAFREALKAESHRKGITLPADNSRTKSLSEIVRSQNTTHFIRTYVKESGAKGATPSEVKRALERENIKAHRNYAYAVLLRLKSKGELSEREGRYYAETVQ